MDPSGIGKVFTILLIFGGVASATYAVVSMAEFVVEGHFRRIIERRRMERQIADLDGTTLREAAMRERFHR